MSAYTNAPHGGQYAQVKAGSAAKAAKKMTPGQIEWVTRLLAQRKVPEALASTAKLYLGSPETITSKAASALLDAMFALPMAHELTEGHLYSHDGELFLVKRTLPKNGNRLYAMALTGELSPEGMAWTLAYVKGTVGDLTEAEALDPQPGTNVKRTGPALGAWYEAYEAGTLDSIAPEAQAQPEDVPLPDVPAGRYAVASIVDVSKDVEFFWVERWPGKGPEVTRVKQLIGGHPFRRITGAVKRAVLDAIVKAGIPEAGHAYGVKLGRCMVCNKELTDPESRSLGIGPDCRTKTGTAYSYPGLADLLNG
jgi:hypothetical protein